VVATASEAQNGDTASTTAELTVTVLAVGDAPLARDASFTLLQDGSVRIDFAGLVSDVDGDPLTLTLGRPKRGTLTRNDDGSYTYVPKKGCSGTDSFSYTVSDGKTSVTATIALTITQKPEDDDRDGRQGQGKHLGFDHRGHHGYRAGDDDRHENAGRGACITVRSEQGAKNSDDRHNHADSVVLDQSKRPSDNAIKVEWSGASCNRLTGVSAKSDERLSGLLGTPSKGQSLAEQTGLVVRFGK
jgi:hypothetical protein